MDSSLLRHHDVYDDVSHVNYMHVIVLANSINFLHFLMMKTYMNL